MKNKILFFLGCIYSMLIHGQLDTYTDKIELLGVKDQWHAIELPNPVFGKISQKMADLRVYGITSNDTIEAPYLLKISAEKSHKKKVDFKLLNTVSNERGYYFTYEIPTLETINEIQLNFKNKNFDWKIVLEASHDQKEWFTLLNDYRLLSIKNTQTYYRYTHLNFKDSKYRYYRLLVLSEEKPILLKSTLEMKTISPATFREYGIKKLKIKEVEKKTILDIDLKQRLPVSFLKLEINDPVDYYRPFTLQYMSDSVKTEKGWRYNYRNLSSGTLTSIEKNGFKFSSTLTEKLRVTIQNHDNEPLTIENAEVNGYLHQLIARFSKPANYYLAYGKAEAIKPQYDIRHADFKIPNNPPKLILGEVIHIKKSVSPLFENKIWLWVIMIIIIIVVGGFSLNMMQKKMN